MAFARSNKVRISRCLMTQQFDVDTNYFCVSQGSREMPHIGAYIVGTEFVQYCWSEVINNGTTAPYIVWRHQPAPIFTYQRSNKTHSRFNAPRDVLSVATRSIWCQSRNFTSWTAPFWRHIVVSNRRTIDQIHVCDKVSNVNRNDL